MNKAKRIKHSKAAPFKAGSVCNNCGERGSHFVPPSFGEDGFYVCKKSNV